MGCPAAFILIMIFTLGEYTLSRDTSIANRINSLRSKFGLYFHNEPTFLFIGKEEQKEISIYMKMLFPSVYDGENDRGFARIFNGSSFLGLEIVVVDRESFLKVSN